MVIYPLFTLLRHNQAMNEAKVQEQLSWFTFSLAAQRSNLSKIFLRLCSIGARAGTSLAIHRKFMCLMDQIALDKAKELDLICDIEQIEKRHALLRQRHLLRQARGTILQNVRAPRLAPVEQPEEKPARLGLFKLMALFALFSSTPTHHKNQ